MVNTEWEKTGGDYITRKGVGEKGEESTKRKVRSK